MATTFNDALQEFNIGASSTTNVGGGGGNIVIPQGSETLSDLLKLIYDFKETPLVPNDKSYNIYIWNNNTDGEIRFYTKDAKNNNNFNQNTFSGTYNEPRLEYNTKIGKDGKLYFWHSYNILLPTKTSGWYSVVDDIYGLSYNQQVQDVILATTSGAIISINTSLNTLATTTTTFATDTTAKISIIEGTLTLHYNQILTLEARVGNSFNYTKYIDDIVERGDFDYAIQALFEIFDDATNPLTSIKQLEQIGASTTITKVRTEFGFNVANALVAIGGAAAIGGAIATYIDNNNKEEYANEAIKLTDNLVSLPISSANNILNHTRITIVSGNGGFSLTSREFLVPIQRNAVLRFGINTNSNAYLILVEQIGDTYFAVNETITINKNLINSGVGSLVLTITSLGTLREWTELRTLYLRDKIVKIDTKNRRKAGVIGFDDININHFTKANASYVDNEAGIAETILYNTLEINPNYKVPTAIEADTATNADTAGVAVKLQTKRKIANVDFDGTADIAISYTNLTNPPTNQLWEFNNTAFEIGKYTYNNVGIGTLPSSSYMLNIYDDMNANIRLQSSSEFGATTSIEFRKGVINDVWNDYKLINDNGIFKLQFESLSFPYGSAVNDIIKFHSADIRVYKPTRFDDNIGIGTDAIFTYKLDILGDARITGVLNSVGTINSTNYAIGGLDVFNAETKKLLPARIDMANIDLNINKIYEKFNQTNFAIVDNKIDLPASYSINITAYDSPTLYIPNDPRRLKGKMNVSYDDRQGIYKLEATNITKTDNVAVLKYQVGDKISIRNTAEPAKDFLLYDGFKYYMSVILVKRPSNRPLDHYVDDIYSTLLFEWKSSDGLEGRLPAYVMDYRPTTDVSYPFTTIMTLIVEAGFNYYLYKLWAQTEVSAGGTIFVELSGYGDDNDDFNRFYGAGQTFKLRSDYVFAPNDYTPRNYTPAQAGIALQNTAGLVKPRRGMALDDEGGLSAIPLSSDLITNMNTSHFTNNTGTNKIDISSTYVAPSATKLATSRNIAGVGFDGSANIDISYDNLTGKPNLFDGAYNSLTGKPNLFDGAYNSLSGKPNLFSGNYNDLTNKLSAGSGINIDTTTTPYTISATAQTPTSGSLVGILNTTQFENNVATSRVDIKTGWKPTTAGTADNVPYSGITSLPTSWTTAQIPELAISKITGLQGALDGKAPTSHTHVIGDITNLQTTLDGKAPTSHSHAIANITNLQTALDAKQATLTSANTIGVFNTNDFINNVGTGKIDLSQNTSNYVLRLDGQTSNYVARVNTSLLTTMGTLQPTINSTAGQVIIGNGDGFTTTSTGLTWVGGTTNTLNATNLTTTNLLTTPNLAVSTYATITRELTSVLSGGVDMFELRNNATNNLRFNQTWIAANDMRWQLIQKSNNVDYPLINFRNGKISVGTYSNPAYQLELVGDINITGAYRVNGTILKPANAVLADTATALATSRNIAGVAFNGTADIAIDYFGLNNKPIILQPTTTNLQLTSGYTLSVPSNLAVGTTSIPTNILQVGAGGRLRISNGTTDYTLLGTIDADGSTNTSIVISGNTRSTNAGNIQYLATASGGSHIFYTASTTTRMTISSSGVNVNNDLGVTGNVGIGVAPATYKLNVSGDINCTGVFRIGGVALANSAWIYNSVDATKLYYNGGNVGIGTTNPQQKLDIQGINPTIKLLDTGTDGNAIIQFREFNDLYGMDIAYIGNMDNKMYIRSYNNSATPVNNITIDRGSGYIGLGTTNPIYKCHIKCTYDNASTGIHLDAGETDTATNKYTLNISPYVIAGGQVGWRFRTQNFTGGTYTPLTLNNYGNVVIGGNLNAVNINCDTSYVLGTEVYARNSFDTRIRSDSGGMYLEMGYIGSAGGLLKIGAYNSVTNIDSGESRDIYFRCNGYRWYFANNGWSVNGLNTSAWVAFSDHRIKENIKKADLKICYDNVKNINLYRYNYIDGFCKGTKYDRTQLGYVAQQVKEHFPKSVRREKTRIDDKREIPDLASIDVSQINLTLFGAVKQLMRVVENQSKRIKKLEEMLNIIDDDVVEDDADEPYERIVCDEVDIDDIEPSEPTGV